MLVFCAKQTRFACKVHVLVDEVEIFANLIKMLFQIQQDPETSSKESWSKTLTYSLRDFEPDELDDGDSDRAESVTA